MLLGLVSFTDLIIPFDKTFYKIFVIPFAILFLSHCVSPLGRSHFDSLINIFPLFFFIILCIPFRLFPFWMIDQHLSAILFLSNCVTPFKSSLLKIWSTLFPYFFGQIVWHLLNVLILKVFFFFLVKLCNTFWTFTFWRFGQNLSPIFLSNCVSPLGCSHFESLTNTFHLFFFCQWMTSSDRFRFDSLSNNFRIFLWKNLFDEYSGVVRWVVWYEGGLKIKPQAQ